MVAHIKILQIFVVCISKYEQPIAYCASYEVAVRFAEQFLAEPDGNPRVTVKELNVMQAHGFGGGRRLWAVMSEEPDVYIAGVETILYIVQKDVLS